LRHAARPLHADRHAARGRLLSRAQRRGRSGELSIQRRPRVDRRSLLYVRDALWVIVDHIDGERASPHRMRLHWQLGTFEVTRTSVGGCSIATPSGKLELAVYDEMGSQDPRDRLGRPCRRRPGPGRRLGDSFGGARRSIPSRRG
jgi:hypothetical protein